jgi:hypothetical protein
MFVSNHIFVTIILLHQMMFSSAFTASLKLHVRPSSKLFMADDLETAASDSPVVDGIESGSHQELMYALGVNLARCV